MLDRQNSLRPVYGIGGGFHVDAPSAERVISSACSRTLCLAKTESALISGNSIASAPPGDARIALDTTGATIYFPQIGRFERWQNGSLTMLNLSIDGTVLSLRSSVSGLNFAVARSGIVWIITAGGTISDSLPLGAGAVLLIAEGTVYATSSALILRKPDGSELSFPAPGVEDLFALSDGYVEARAGGTLYALRTIAAHEQLFQLPQPQTGTERQR
jgi:hypothetical protein